ncbi:MAG: GC-type dockerin domain-anchored protein [Phycisphaerales bacterium]
MRLGFSTVSALVLAIVNSAIAVDFTEVEPNDDKSQANVVVGMQPGDALVGTSTGSSSTPGLGSGDFFDITTAPAGAPGIYRYRLTITTTGLTGHVGSIRGLTQTNGVINAGTDLSVHTSIATQDGSLPPRTVQWYANETPSRIYFRVSGASVTTAPYRVELARDPVIPNIVPLSIEAGSFFYSTIGQTSVNTDTWVYDSNLVAIPDTGNDDETLAGGGTGDTTQSRLQRTLPAGNYILAVSNYNLVNDQAQSAADDDFANNPVVDFPNAICTTGSGSNQNNSFVIGNRCSGLTIPVGNTRPERYDVTFWAFTLTGPSLPDPVVLGSGAATPTSVGQGQTAVLTVIASDGVPTGVSADLTAFGLSSSVAFNDSGVNGDATPGDGIWSRSFTIPLSQIPGSYTVQVSSTVSGSCAAPSTSISFSVYPPNNTCATATPISVGGSYVGSTLGALGAGGPTSTCNAVSSTNPGVWYVFTETSPIPRRLRLDLCDPITNFDAQISMFTGSCGSLSCVWGNDSSPLGCVVQSPSLDNGPPLHTNTPAILNWAPTPTGEFLISHCTTPGTTYYICVTNKVAANGGHFVLHFSDTGQPCPGTPPPNSTCVTARNLTTFPYWEALNLYDGTADPQPASCVTSPRTSVWYRFAPTSPGSLYCAKVPDDIPSNDGLLTVFRAVPDCTNLVEIACQDFLDAYGQIFIFPITTLNPGSVYYLLYTTKSNGTNPPQATSLGFDFATSGVVCVADVDDGTGTGTPDGGVTIDDLLYYLAIFNLGLPSADVDNGTGTGTLDGGVTIDDLLYYLARFNAGC